MIKKVQVNGLTVIYENSQIKSEVTIIHPDTTRQPMYLSFTQAVELMNILQFELGDWTNND